MCVKVFVSHSHHDNAFCQRLVAYLREQVSGADVFYDADTLRGGEEWLRRIQQEVLDSPTFVVILSPYSVVADWVREETNLALNRAVKDMSRRVIPVRIAACSVDTLAPFLAMRQIIDLGDDAPDSNWQQLVQVVRREVPDRAQHLDATRTIQLERSLQFAGRVHDAFAAERWRDVVDVARQAVKMVGNEQDLVLWEELVEAYERLGRRDQAVDALGRALEINSARVDLWRRKARNQMMLYADSNARPLLVVHARDDWSAARAYTNSPSEKLLILREEYDAMKQAGELTFALEVSGHALEYEPNSVEWRKAQASIRGLQLGPEVFPRQLRDFGFTAVVIENDRCLVPPVVEVPADRSLMGSNPADDPHARENEFPQHVHTLPGYLIALYPVTVAEYACAVHSGIVEPPDIPGVTWGAQVSALDHAVVGVSWTDACRYAEWLSEMTGDTWRLPSEAEWEKAARGTDGRVYPWGDLQMQVRATQWFAHGPQPGGAIGDDRMFESPYGVFGIGTNVFEWCGSPCGSYRSLLAPPVAGAAISTEKVIRSNVWYSPIAERRAAARRCEHPDHRSHSVGFRLVRAY